MNVMLLSGRLTKDAKASKAKKGGECVSFGLAVKDMDNLKANAQFVHCTAFGKFGGMIKKWCKKGDFVEILGAYKTLERTADNGQKFECAVCNMKKIQFVQNNVKGRPDKIESTDDKMGEIPSDIFG